MPMRCVFCGTRVQAAERTICSACRDDLPWLDNPYSHAPSPLTRSMAVLAYAFPVDAAIKALKFGRKHYYAPALGELLCQAASLPPDDIDALLPVPLHWRRLTLRGFNQALEISKPLARERKLPIVSGVVRCRSTKSQSGLTAAERSRNLKDAFAVRAKLPFDHVLIVDDVVTTGATSQQLARTLLQNGVSRVSVMAVARAA